MPVSVLVNFQASFQWSMCSLEKTNCLCVFDKRVVYFLLHPLSVKIGSRIYDCYKNHSIKTFATTSAEVEMIGWANRCLEKTSIAVAT